MLNNTTVVRINITIPKELVYELEKEVPERGKSSFISLAIEEKLIRERRIDALKKLSTLPPAFKDIKNSAEFVEKMRATDDKNRSKELTE